MEQTIFRYRNEMIHTAQVISTTRTPQFSLHCHTYYEVYYFIRGEVSYLVEGTEYRPAPHSLLLFSPNRFHGVRIDSDVPYERYTMHFHPGLLTPEASAALLSPFSPQGQSGQIYYAQTDLFPLTDSFQSLFAACRADEDIRPFSIRIQAEALLNQILLMSRAQSITHGHRTGGRPVEEILEYLNHHLTDALTLDSLADRFFISKYHLGVLFKRATGTTVMDYVTRKRLAAARQLMAEGEPAGTAALRAGFGDYSVFFRAYKKVYGSAPSDFHANLLL